MNYADSARIKAVLTNCWFSHTDNIQEADIVIFDTCSVRQKSEDKITGKLKEISKHQKIRITGCMIQHNLRNQKLSNKKLADNLKIWNFLGNITNRTPKVIWLNAEDIHKIKSDSWSSSVFINHAFNPTFHNLSQTRANLELFFRIDDLGFLPIILKELGYKISYDGEITNEYSKIASNWFNTSMNSHHKTAYIPISTWCNQFCSYCIVPYARWLEKHYPKSQIIQEVEEHIQSWAEEIVLLGQIVNKHPEFVEIIKDLLKLKWLKRLRYTSPYPNFYSPELLELHESEAKLCPHIHIPLQSWSDSILKSMRRWYDSKQAKEFIDNIRSLQRNISITTDIIVWYPGESEKDFQDTLELVKYSKFDMIYIWIYSPRPGTYAYKNHPDNIDRKTKRNRRNQLNNLLKTISLENNQKEIWQIRTVIVDKLDWNNIYWYTDNMKQIVINNPNPTKKVRIWDFINSKITESQAFKLLWEIIDHD